MRRLTTAVLLAGALLVTACGGSADVSTERAAAIEPTDIERGPTTASELPTTTESAESGEPVPDASPSTPQPNAPAAPAPPADRRPADPSFDDPLFPELGSPDVDVIAYDVELDAREAFDDGPLRGLVTVEADVPLDVGELALDAIDFFIVEVTLQSSGDQLEIDYDGSELAVILPAERDERVVVEIAYSVTPDAADRGSVGLPSGWFQRSDTSFVLNEPDGARTWMPANDHPSDKATWSFSIQPPPGTVVAANGTLLAEGDDDAPWRWSLDEPMATYLVQVVIGDYDVVDGGSYRSIDGDEIELTHVVPSGQLDRFAEEIELLDEQLPWFEERFGPYPLASYGLAFVEMIPGVAMETQGRSMFDVGDFTRSGIGGLEHLLLGHELAHQWYGNAVSPATWDEIWLNEGFATYVQWMWQEETGARTVEDRALEALSLRQGGVVATGSPDPSNLFSFEVYDGGAVVLHALRKQYGDDLFFELLPQWVERFSGTSQSTEALIELTADLVVELSTEVGAEADAADLDPATVEADVREFFTTWLYSPQPPAQFPS